MDGTPTVSGIDLADLIGEWRLEREILAVDGAPMGRVAGVLVVTRRPDGAADAAERGRLRTGGVELEARRDQIWRVDRAGGLCVADPGGPNLWRFDLDAARSAAGATTLHDCAPDRYAGRLSLDAQRPPAWLTLVWRVSGPRKAYVSTTRYARADLRDRGVSA